MEGVGMQPTRPRVSGLSDGGLLFLILIALLLLRLIVLYLNPTGLHFDEAQYWYWSQHPAMGYFSKPPVVAWLIGLTTEVCGSSSPFCVRLGSPIITTGTAYLVFLIAREAYDARTGLWAGVTIATVPAVSFSSHLISTDVPLLFFWAGALFSWIRLLETRAWRWAIMLGMAIGFGLMSKYAMVYFLLCAGVYFIVEPTSRWLLRDPRLAITLALAALIVAPNILWNAENGFITFSHTADNAKWSGPLLNWGRGLEFLGSQFGVAGPIVFGVFLVIIARIKQTLREPADRLMLSFSLPIITLVLVQAFISRAHANWAATALVALIILVVGVLMRRKQMPWLKASLGLHLIVMLVIGGGFMFADRVTLGAAETPISKLFGWSELANTVRERVRQTGARSVLVDTRELAAQMLYSLRGTDLRVYEWKPRAFPSSHFELKMPISRKTPEPGLLLTRRETAEHLIRLFGRIDPAGQAKIRTSATGVREINFFLMSQFKEKPDGTFSDDDN